MTRLRNSKSEEEQANSNRGFMCSEPRKLVYMNFVENSIQKYQQASKAWIPGFPGLDKNLAYMKSHIKLPDSWISSLDENLVYMSSS